MKIDRKKKLIELGPEALADALLELAVRDDTADDLDGILLLLLQINLL